MPVVAKPLPSKNGYFSRLITLIIDEHQAFNSRYVQPSENSGDIIKGAVERLYHLYESLLFTHPREFSLTKEQKARLGNHLETAYPTLIRVTWNSIIAGELN